MKIIGLMAFLLIGGTAGSEFLSLLTLPEVQAAAESSIPFLAGHFTTLTLAAGIVFALTVIAIPPYVLSNERETGQSVSVFEKIGIGAAIAAGVASIGYLLGMGWLVAGATL